MTTSESLNTVTDYLLHNLRGTVELVNTSRPESGEPWKDELWLRSSIALTIWVTLYRSGEYEGKVQVEGYSDPFGVVDLPRVGPSIVAKLTALVK